MAIAAHNSAFKVNWIRAPAIIVKSNGMTFGTK